MYYIPITIYLVLQGSSTETTFTFQCAANLSLYMGLQLHILYLEQFEKYCKTVQKTDHVVVLENWKDTHFVLSPTVVGASCSNVLSLSHFSWISNSIFLRKSSFAVPFRSWNVPSSKYECHNNNSRNIQLNRVRLFYFCNCLNSSC